MHDLRHIAKWLINDDGGGRWIPDEDSNLD